MSQDTKQSAIEAAARVLEPLAWEICDKASDYANLNPRQAHPHSLKKARAAILAYLSALVEDEGAVEAVAKEIWLDNGGRTHGGGYWEPNSDLITVIVAKATARAVLRTLATRAQGESS